MANEKQNASTAFDRPKMRSVQRGFREHAQASLL